MKGDYVPDVGDVVWIDFDPQAGREQAGHRPALVLSGERYNRLTGLMLCCPMTSRLKGFPFEVVESRDPPSAVLADHVKSLDWRARAVRRKGAIAPSTLAEVRSKIASLLLLS